MFTEGLRDLHVMIFWWGSVWTLGKKDNEREETFFHRFCPSIGIDKHYFLSKLDQLSFPDIVLWGFNSIHFLLVKLLSLLLTYLESENISHSVMSDSLRPRGLYSPLCSSVHRIPQAGILEWVDIPFSKWSSRPKPRCPAFQADSLPSEPPGKPSSPILLASNAQLKSSFYNESQWISPSLNQHYLFGCTHGTW